MHTLCKCSTPTDTANLCFVFYTPQADIVRVGIPVYYVIQGTYKFEFYLKFCSSYRHVFHGLHQLFAYEDVRVVLKSANIVMIKVAFMTVGQLAVYEFVKQALLNTKYFVDDVKTYLASSFSAVSPYFLYYYYRHRLII